MGRWIGLELLGLGGLEFWLKMIIIGGYSKTDPPVQRELCPELGLELEVLGPKGLKFQNTNSKGCGVKTKI